MSVVRLILNGARLYQAATGQLTLTGVNTDNSDGPIMHADFVASREQPGTLLSTAPQLCDNGTVPVNNRSFLLRCRQLRFHARGSVVHLFAHSIASAITSLFTLLAKPGKFTASSSPIADWPPSRISPSPTHNPVNPAENRSWSILPGEVCDNPVVLGVFNQDC